MENRINKAVTSIKMDRIKDIRFINNMAELFLYEEGPYAPRIYFVFEKGALRIFCTLNETVLSNQDSCCFEKINENIFMYTDKITENRVEFSKDPFKFTVKDKYDNTIVESSQKPFDFLTITGDDEGKARKIKFCFKTYNEYYFGFGEKYNKLNQKGLNTDSLVIEQYTNQQEKTYMPIPFFITEKGYGMYVNSNFYITYGLSSKSNDLLEIEAKVNSRSPFLDLYILFGRPKEIIGDYLKITSYPVLPPKWSFGPWMSSNRWNTMEEAVKQVELTKKYEIPATVLVLEAWSDEATFYIFNDAVYKPCSGGEYLEYKDFSFNKDGKWPDPQGMIDFIHKNNIKLVLWQIPVIKHFANVEIQQHSNDEKYMIEKKFCILNADGTPYRITYNWFCNSLVLDFTNPDAREWWFNKRRYLQEVLKVDGFKTDGGEFIYDEETCFHDGRKGDEMRNFYPVSYISAYHDFIGKERITFSRAGYTGAQNYPLYWAGDQESTFAELKGVLTAGLSVNLSGNPFWGFDIAGFVGRLPTSELYIRSTQLAAFCPVMQYHSAPPEGSENNDRTPWNISDYNKDERVLDIYRRYANIRMNLLPYIYNEAGYIAGNGEPFMRHLIIDYPDDVKVYDIEDQYLFGRNILIAPITEDSCRQRNIYFPEGDWIDFWDGTKYTGNSYIKYQCDIDRIPVFIKYNSVIPLNLNNEFEIGGTVGNETDKYVNLCFMIVGEIINTYEFSDDLGNRIIFEGQMNCLKTKISGNIRKIYLLIPGNGTINEISRPVRLNNINCCLYEIEGESEAYG